ncbi:MAG: YifB family Mg chelatase-like AAA ATPase [Fibromonadaceae bacterium]|jgi:magnesium chelatase family protein|nr:YifB family Mg chelatase-like AAA ATPase [Fibromonadaceae bacterium]
MFQRIKSAALRGIEAIPVEIEVDSSPGLPGFSLVGLPDNAVREARERVVSAMRSYGFIACSTKMTVNMSPADLRKEGAAFDLGLAIGMLAATKQIVVANLENFLFLGELSLDGRLRPVRGVLAVAAYLVRNAPQTTLVVPYENAEEATCVESLKVIVAKTLEECLNGLQEPDLACCFYGECSPVSATQNNTPDFSQVYGMASVKRALEISAAGAHNFLLVGSPGSGKTLCARCLPGILPEMRKSESLESTIIHSCAGMFDNYSGLMKSRPFRAPHHTATTASLVGGMKLRPGEASLAHNGVLFLDELPEFQRMALECLRQPLEEGVVRLNRAMGSVSFPANFVFGAAMNPCPCGYAMDSRRDCRCLPEAIKRYRSRVSGPLLDRIDLQVSVPSVPLDESRMGGTGESSKEIQKRVEAAYEIQQRRLPDRKIFRNGHLDGKTLKDILLWSNESEDFALKAAEKWRMSHRGYDRMLKVSRTIADLRCSEKVERSDLAEAVQYRALETTWMD